MPIIKKLGSAAACGLYQLSDMFNLPLARAAVLAGVAGTYVDVYIGTSEAANFICRVQHKLFGAIHHAKIISNFYLSRLGAYDNSVLNLTDPLEMTGTVTAWDGGIATSGNTTLELLFYGLNYPLLRNASLQALVWDAVGTPADKSVVMIGYTDPAGAGEMLGGMGSENSGDIWTCATMTNNVAFVTTSALYQVFATPNNRMQTAKTNSRVRLSLSQMGNASDLGLSMGQAVSHTYPDASRPLGGNATTTYDDNTALTYRVSAAGTTVQSVLEVVSGAPMQAPASGY